MIKPAAFVMILLCAGEAAAQSTDFTGLRLHGNPTVYVTDRSGSTIKGMLVRWTPSQLDIHDGRSLRFFNVSDVALVERNDSLKNGMFIGGAIGVVSGVIGHGFTDCQFDRRCARGSRRLTVGPPALAAWIAIGAAIDALIPGRKPIWP
jgi:hypothetical protein